MAKFQLYLPGITNSRIGEPQRFRRLLLEVAAKFEMQFQPPLGQRPGLRIQ